MAFACLTLTHSTLIHRAGFAFTLRRCRSKRVIVCGSDYSDSEARGCEVGQTVRLTLVRRIEEVGTVLYCTFVVCSLGRSVVCRDPRLTVGQASIGVQIIWCLLGWMSKEVLGVLCMSSTEWVVTRHLLTYYLLAHRLHCEGYLILQHIN